MEKTAAQAFRMPSGDFVAPARPRVRTRHEEDVYGWVQEQVAVLRAGRIDAPDPDNIAEELNDVGLSAYRRLPSAIEIAPIHMIERDRRPERASRSWVRGIAEHRERALMRPERSPGLKSSLDEAQRKAFRLGRLGAAHQMKRSSRALAPDCPRTRDDILDRLFDLDTDR